MPAFLFISKQNVIFIFLLEVFTSAAIVTFGMYSLMLFEAWFTFSYGG